MTEREGSNQQPNHIKKLQMVDITKQFPGVLANDKVNLEVNEGEILALLGENGAGKSTLMKQLYGLYKPDSGKILINGEEKVFNSPVDAINAGIGMIHQHFMLVSNLTVVENVALGLKSSRGLFLDLDVVEKRILEICETYKLKVDPKAYIWQLAVGEQQRVEIIKALYRGADLLILDEPTAVLTPQEVEEFFVILRKMAEAKHSLIFISHKLNEVIEISDRIVILRDGRSVAEKKNENITKTELAEKMVGRPVVLQYEKTPLNQRDIRLKIVNLHVENDWGNEKVCGVDLEIHGGEILGLAGVSGNGQPELAQALAGLRKPTQGKIYLNGKDVTDATPYERTLAGQSYIPEERNKDGVIKDFNISENFILEDHDKEPYSKHTFFNFANIARETQKAVDDFAVKTPNLKTFVKNLSGGNVQKLILARELSRNPSVLIAAQPTRGVDIGASEYIHQRLLKQRDQGTATLLISEDLDEIRALSDRIAVIFEGKIMGIVDAATATSEQLGLMMAGIPQEEAMKQ
ncbi:MAG TPA: ABC transporter ATP-binding protein [Flexilinea sp.]|jgi:simple sugar transport system ATP-binding protein|nr:ABC transporter ATP-binding protein [Flexilinea sp.]OQA25327.1 MAG: Galactose/methyl galactoside import ATP-binding protein MglA [Chloroflexi bacterium ADurb.Bin344]HOG22590.1 ABC transporter ATP-binding protein [Flexilinea sp.]HOG60969.1 ABC transporter ATP-binding protein [Flexilinea sp.]HOP02516.1 ABC transporter ATP-binding protein [Flexilinea sp.]